MTQGLIVVGGGLAGSEAAWQAAEMGLTVTLYEMRPGRSTGAHKTGFLGELVCSNSLRSADLMNAAGLLKEELRMAGSLIMRAAMATQVPAGSALVVNREEFSSFITTEISRHPNIRILREEIFNLPDVPAVIATGPLTSPSLAEAIGRAIGSDHLYFYDAIAPIIDAESIDYDKVYFASRYGKGGDDYVNCPMTVEIYAHFLDALLEADKVGVREFEDQKVFEGCMPVEAMALRGRDTLRFGPMKPVGLPDPRTGREPYAVVQLRPENRERSSYNIVGFQTRLTWPEQKKVFRLIPGLEHAEFFRYGSLHRNTYINSPKFLNKDLTLKTRESLYLAGQITGVEGYIESTAMGLLAGINAARLLKGFHYEEIPETTAHGSLVLFITTPRQQFQPSNINFGLLPSADSKVRGKELKRKTVIEKALRDWGAYLRRVES